MLVLGIIGGEISSFSYLFTEMDPFNYAIIQTATKTQLKGW